jgi:hypothetical protein
MTVLSVLDAAGRRRSPATLPGYHPGRPPRNKGTLPSRPTHGGRDRRRHAPQHRRPSRLARTSDDRRPLARRPAHPGSARARRARPRPPARIDPTPQRQGRPTAGGRHGRVGLGVAAAVAERTRRTSGRPAVLHHRRPHPRATVVRRRRSHRAPPTGRRRRRQAALRPPPAAPRACHRTGPRGRAAEHHPTTARPHQPRHDVDLPARDRPRGDHRHRPMRRAPMMSQRRCATLSHFQRERAGAPAHP